MSRQLKWHKDNLRVANLWVTVIFILGICAGCKSSGSAATPDMAFFGSGLGPDEIPLRIDQTCPGDPGCPAGGDGVLYVATAKRDITPVVEPFTDSNGNLQYDPGEPYVDLNGNGKFDPVFLAGRNSGTYAFGVHDPIWLRCYVVRQNQTTLANCVIDALGYFDFEQWQTRADLDPKLGIDLLLMSATHDHQSKDVLGIWGPDDLTTGYDPVYMARIRELTQEALAEAVGNLRAAKMSIASIATQDPSGDMSPYISDTRDPVVIDPVMHLMQFDDATTGKPIVTVVNWGAHPDSLGSDRHYVSSDWVNYFRLSLEAGTGSDVVFIQGQCGGQVGPGGVLPYDANGQRTKNNHDYTFVETWGNEIGRMALKAFATRTEVASPTLAFRKTTFSIHVENVFYQTAAFLNLFGGRAFYGYDPNKPLIRDASGDNAPLTDTEVTYITLGPASIITCPGELLPENFIGGYDGSDAGGFTFIDTMQPNAPDPTKAPKAPYLRDMMPGPLEHRMVFGLTGDFLGYIIPRYNFVLDPVAPYINRAAGDHYEETNSVGPRAEPEIVGTMRQLVLSATAPSGGKSN